MRCNARRTVGFLKDERRLNVALTRARLGLVVIGSARTLAADPLWARWVEWMDLIGGIVEPRWVRR